MVTVTIFKIIEKYGCLLRFIIQNCEFDESRKDRARRRLERRLCETVFTRIQSKLDDKGAPCSFAEIEFFVSFEIICLIDLTK